MLVNFPLLSLTIWLPILAGLLILCLGREDKPALAKYLALSFAIVTLGLSVILYANFDPNLNQLQLTELKPWIPFFKINYALGIDGMALTLIMLTTFTVLLVVIAGWKVITQRVNQYFAAFLLMEGLMCGVFAASDAILFYVFWEAMLIPMFLIIGIWGGPRRVYAAIKFFLYTFLGSILMLVALLYLYFKTNSFALADFAGFKLGLSEQKLIFWAFLIAFAVKIPMWPVHTWLPDAHVEAPTGGSVVLAAIMLKMGTYGMLRFSLPIVPDACSFYANLIITLSLIAIVYIGLVAIVQKDMKKLIAYSSIAHMGFVTLGIFAIYVIMAKTGSKAAAELGMQGALVQMISHGFVSGALFLGVGVLYDRLHTREIDAYGGVAHRMPIFAAFFMLFAMANAGLPGTSGFVGEFMVIVSSFQAGFWVALAAGTSLILGAAYSLWMYKRVFFGKVANEGVASLSDISGREKLLMWLLALAVLAVGIYPQLLTGLLNNSVHQIMMQGLYSKLS